MKSRCILLLLHLSFMYHSNAEPLVQVNQGILNGTIQKSRSGRNYSAFLGIPYGQPPIGNLRFRNPVEAENWEGIRSANSFGNICIQKIFGLVIGKEDCLYLNVYTPFLEFDSSLKNFYENNTLLPVMVWFHGGGFYFGSGKSYGAEYLLDKDVLLVTLNYRLGIFGFLSTGDSAAPGNFGMKDQVLALKWVQKNIKAFGGDPNRVTIFGQSAGGASVSLHSISKASNGLFHQYIIESGAALCPWVFKEKSNYFHHVRKTAALVFCPLSSSLNLVNCLRKRNAIFLIYASEIIDIITRFGQLTWAPTNEPEADDAFLTDSPKNLIENNQMKDLPFISGVNTEEGLFLTGIFYSLAILFTPLKLILKPIITYAAGHFYNVANTTEFTTAVEKFYFNNSINSGERIEVVRNLTKFTTDGLYLYPELTMLEKVTPHMNNSNYLYSFGYRGTFSFMSLFLFDKRDFGVAHAEEMFYLFPISIGPFRTSTIKMTAADELISKLMVDLWTSFATNGKPTSEELKEPYLWKPYDTQNNTHLQIGNIFNNSDPLVTLSTSLCPDRMKFWKENSFI